MARNAKNTSSDTKAPDFIVWHVIQKGDKSHWSKVGASWHHKDRKGLPLQLEVIPINGRIVLRQPLDNPQDKSDQST